MSALPLRSPGPREDAREAALWVLGLAVALALHAALGAYLLGRASPSPGAVTDLPAVMVDMAPPSAAPRLAPEPPRPEIAPSAAPDPVPEAPRVPDTPPPPPEPVIREAVPPEPEPPMPETAPLAAEERAAALEPVPELPMPPPPAVVPPKPEVVLPPPPKAAMPAAKPVVAPPAPPRPRVAKPLPPKPQTRAEPRPARPVRAEVRAPRNEERRAQSAAAGARQGPVVASPGASAASAASWRARLIAYLQGNLRYPAGATAGSAFVTFSMVRSGQVTSARLARSAGNPALDAAALALFRGALPPPPPDVPGSSFSFNIPIRFTQR